MAEWNRALLDDEDVVRRLPPDVVSSGWLGYPGATEAQLAQAEVRLGILLPPSYREFLGFTNGWRYLTPFIWRVWSTEEIEWFSTRNQQWIDAYTNVPYPYDNAQTVPDFKYFVYGDDQDSVWFRTEYLQTALEISEEGDSAVMLLNPQVATPDGEWEAWFFANWLPGARRYRSFWEMMQDEYRGYLTLTKD